ncbi:thioredoxin reductase (NADPH) [Micrococcus cohnii]|uniref:Thioredoxin reductase n=1 Tax=Micrococcus cohnii TaxID=993416 RepID=A0A7W7GQ95_9MICC|nr:thioredoxin-disulfide reductase [Micrococcus cohnii]MBB4736255.1 thioredoxin reductase (NADPH) [Micrococcus cohnii]
MSTAETAEKVHNVAIVGSGPAGYTAAVYTARAHLEPVLVAGAVTAGGELMNTTEVENFPGFPEGVMGPELMANMESQARRFGTDVVFDDVVQADLTSQPKRLTLGDGTVLRAHAVILTTGSAYRKLGVPGEERLSGHGVSWCATCDGFFFRDQHIAVVGGGDSAMEEALFLTKFASKVTVLVRKDELRASKIMAQRARENDKIEFLWNTKVTEVLGEDAVSGLALEDTATGESSTLDVTGLFIAIGHDPRTDLVSDQLELTEHGTIRVEHPSSRTSLTGVFAAGDVTDHTYRQAITAAGSGCVAAQDVEHFLAEALDVAEAAPAGPESDASPA